jgi:serine/threonine-protein kinase
MNDEYFKIIADIYKNILFISVKGIWDNNIAKKYKKEFKKIVEPLVLSGEPWYVIADISEYPPQEEDVKAVHRELMDFAKNHGMLKAANIVDEKTYEEHIRKLSEESGLDKYGFFRTINDAEKWLIGDND